MSGHSKWANIKHRKGRQDAKRGKLFAKLCRAVEAAARNGGSDLSANPALVTAVQKAKDNSVPKDNIERAISRGAGEVDGAAYEEVWYEGYASGGVAVYVHVLTDNRNRSSSDVRSAFSKNGGSLGEPGSVAYLFEQKGMIVAVGDEDTILMAALEGGADDVAESGEGFEIVTDVGDLGTVRAALEDADVTIEQAEVTQLPTISVELGPQEAASVLRLIDALDDLDDVQDVYANFEMSEEVLAELS